MKVLSELIGSKIWVRCGFLKKSYFNSMNQNMKFLEHLLNRWRNFMFFVTKWSELIGRDSITNEFTFYEFKVWSKLGTGLKLFRDGAQYPAFKIINFRLPQSKEILPGKGEYTSSNQKDFIPYLVFCLLVCFLVRYKYTFFLFFL